LLEALCRICGVKLKGKERKAEDLKCVNKIREIWKVSVLVDSANVHPKYICMKCRVKCSNKDYLAGRNKPSQEAKLWFPHSDDFVVCQREEARGRPLNRTRGGVAKKEGEPGSDTDSASEHENEPESVSPRVYFLSMNTIQDCISKIPETDQNAIFQELCCIIPKAQLLELLLNSLKGVYVLQEDDLSGCIAKVPEDMQTKIVPKIIQEQKSKLLVDCDSFTQTNKELDILQDCKAEEWFSQRNPIVTSVIKGLASNEKNYLQLCLALEHLYHL